MMSFKSVLLLVGIGLTVKQGWIFWSKLDQFNYLAALLDHQFVFLDYLKTERDGINAYSRTISDNLEFIQIRGSGIADLLKLLNTLFRYKLECFVFDQDWFVWLK